MPRYDGISVRRLPSGRYQYRVRDPDVARYEAKTFERTKEDAKRENAGTAAGDRWAENQLARFQLGQATAEPADLGAVVAAYLADLRGRKRKGKPLNPTHVRDVERTLANLAAACPGVDLNRPMPAARAIKAWWTALEATPTNEKGKVLRRNLTLAPRTRQRYWIHATSLMAWAVGEGVILRNPLARVKIDTEHDSEPVVFTLTQARAIVAHGAVDDPAWRWVVLMLLGGLRRAEALALKWEDVLWPQHLLRVVKGKGGAGRLVGLQPDLRDILAEIGGGPDAKVRRIGSIVGDLAKGNRKLEWVAFRRLLVAAGVEPDQGKGELSGRPVRLHPHSCRHTFAALMLASGFDSMLLRQYLGHCSDAMTTHFTKLAAMFTAEINAEHWNAGELRLLPPTVTLASDTTLVP